MASIVGFVRRNQLIFNPPQPPKTENPLKFGILGAADIAPNALIIPARSHPDVVIQAVAARDPEKAKAFADKHGIPEVKATYQEILDDPDISCVYVPLPTGLHFEWSLRALKAGKHVLVEKPGTSNAEEAKLLFNHPLLSSQVAPILMEACHSEFHPAWTAFMSYISPSDISKAWSALWAPWGYIKDDDIRYQWDLAGGAMKDLSAYTAAIMRRIFDAEPEECLEATVTPGPRDPRCEKDYKARFRFPNGGFGEIEGSLKAFRLSPDIDVTHRPVAVSGGDAGMEIAEGEEVIRTRRVCFKGFAIPSHYHYIQVDDDFILRKVGDDRTIIKKWSKNKTVKVYTWRDIDVDRPGEAWWLSYRYLLEEFVNKVRGREVTQWIDGEDSIRTAEMIDMAYEKARQPVRPTSQYR